MRDVDQKLTVYLAHRAALIDYAARFIGNRVWAEDVVQEAYLRFVAPEEKEGAPVVVLHPVGYLYRIVRNLAHDWALRSSHERPHATGGRTLRRTPARAPTPELEALYRDELRAVADALTELPERTRRAFEMHRLGDCTLNEIKQELGISVTLAHQLVRKALAHCTERLAGGQEPIHYVKRPRATQ